MIIVCSSCKKVMGEQKPYKDSSEIKATCTTCIEKAKEKAARFKTTESALSDGKEIILGKGIKGTLWVAKSKEEELSIGAMVVAGKKFFCSKNERINFQSYLDSLQGEEADVTVLHSLSFKVEMPPKGRRKNQDPPKMEDPKKDETIHYNCTMRVNKHYIQPMFDDLAGRMDTFIKIIADAAHKSYKEDREKEAQGNDKTPTPDAVNKQASSTPLLENSR